MEEQVAQIVKNTSPGPIFTEYHGSERWPVSFPLFVLAVILLPMALVLGAACLWRRRRIASRRRSPLTRELIRLPGHGLLQRIEESSWDIPALLAALAMIPGTMLAIWGYRVWARGQGAYWDGIGFIALLSAMVIMLLLAALWKMFDKRQRLLDGFRAELATAQALDSLKGQGCLVFHDVQAGDFNIDHVVIGPAGVFAVETKSRRKPVRGKGREDARVCYDGERLRFPDWTDARSLEQAARQARWLEDHLSRSIGARMAVRPVLSLPGWFVECTGRGVVSVINPVNCGWMARSSWQPGIDAAALDRARLVLEGLCTVGHDSFGSDHGSALTRKGYQPDKSE